MKKYYKCTICGEILEEGVDVCPICGATSDKFIEITEDEAKQLVTEHKIGEGMECGDKTSSKR